MLLPCLANQDFQNGTFNTFNSIQCIVLSNSTVDPLAVVSLTHCNQGERRGEAKSRRGSPRVDTTQHKSQQVGREWPGEVEGRTRGSGHSLSSCAS